MSSACPLQNYLSLEALQQKDFGRSLVPFFYVLGGKSYYGTLLDLPRLVRSYCETHSLRIPSFTDSFFDTLLGDEQIFRSSQKTFPDVLLYASSLYSQNQTPNFLFGLVFRSEEVLASNFVCGAVVARGNDGHKLENLVLQK